MAKKTPAKKTVKRSVKKSVKKSAKKVMEKMPKKALKKVAKAVPKKRRKVSSKREMINTGTDKRYVRRRQDGTFKESDDVSRSLSADARHHASTDAPAGMGDQGD